MENRVQGLADFLKDLPALLLQHMSFEPMQEKTEKVGKIDRDTAQHQTTLTTGKRWKFPALRDIRQCVSDLNTNSNFDSIHK